MSDPRQVVAGRTYMFTRRCTQRQFLLRPDPETNQIVQYCLAVMAARYGMQLHALYVASNHYHLVATDTRGEYPLFLRDFHALVARAVNAHRGRWESLWTASAQTSVVHLVDRAAVFAKALYTITNAVKDFLVTRVLCWPGVCSWPMMLHKKARRIARPRKFFGLRSKLPKNVTLRFVKPPQWESWDRWRDRLKQHVNEVETATAKKREAEKRRVLGRKAILRQAPDSQPKSVARRRGLSPRVACRNKWARVERLQRNEHFVRRYRLALERYRRGERKVVFPYGTYQMVRLLRVRSEQAVPTYRPPPSI